MSWTEIGNMIDHLSGFELLALTALFTMAVLALFFQWWWTND